MTFPVWNPPSRLLPVHPSPTPLHTITTMGPPGGAFARRGGKVHSSQRALSPPPSGRGRGKSSGGLGLGKGIAIRRKIKVPKDNIFGITKGDIRRLARRGGVKRISGGVYDTARQSLKEYLTDVPSSDPTACSGVLTGFWVGASRLRHLCRACAEEDGCCC